MSQFGPGPDLALLLLGCYRKLIDATVLELAARGFDDVRPVHEFAMRAIDSGADNASELGRRMSISKAATSPAAPTPLTGAGSGSRSLPWDSRSCARAKQY